MRSISSVWSVVIGFLLAIVAVAVLIFVVGVGNVLNAISSVSPLAAAGIIAISLCWLTAWSLSLRALLGSLGAPSSVPRAFATFSTVTFANNVTPFAQAGAEPLAALLVSRSAGTNYKTSLAAVAGVDTINFLPSIAFALFGAGYFVLTSTLNPQIEVAVLSLVILVAILFTVGFYGWRRRDRVAEAATTLLVPLVQAGSRLAPGSIGADRETVEEHVYGFVDGIERLARDPRRLGVGLFFSAVGWGLLSVLLWVSLSAVGQQVPLEAALFIVPLAMIASLTPLPGGTGGVEAAFIALIVSVTGTSVSMATAATLLYRVGTFWLPILLGGTVALLTEIRRAQ